MAHILIDLARKYTSPLACLPESNKDLAYDIERGYWTIIPFNKPLVEDPKCSILATKKYDRETGEDMKGE